MRQLIFLFSVLLPINFAFGVDPRANEILGVGLEEEIPCHELRRWETRAFPGEFLCWNETNQCLSLGRHAKDFPWFSMPSHTRSIEFRNYPPGQVVMIYPLVDKNKPGEVTHWAVYRATKTESILSLTDVATRAAVDTNWPIESSSAARAAKRKARPPMRMWNPIDIVMEPAQNYPYYQTEYLKNINIPNRAGRLEFHYEVRKESYYYESCKLAGVYTPEQIVTEINPKMRAKGWGGDCNTPNKGAYERSGGVPNCLATYFVGEAADAELDRITLQRLSILPFVGTAIQARECARSGDPWCWGEAAISGVTDIATVAVPILKAGASAKFLRARHAIYTDRALTGFAVLGQGVLATRDFSEKNVLSGMFRLAAGATIGLTLIPPKDIAPRQYKIIDLDPPGVCTVDRGTTAKKVTALNEACTSRCSCRIPTTVAEFPKLYNLSGSETGIFTSDYSTLVGLTMKIKTNPAQAISSIFSLGDSIPVANSELLAKQWGKVRISKRALGAWNRFEERTLKEFWNDAGRQANGNLAKQKQIFAERTEEYFSEFSSEGLFGYNIDTKTIKISEMEMVLENGTVRPLTQGPSTVIGEDILRKTYAQVAVEETMHGMSFGRIGSHKGIFAAGNFYFPFTEQLDEFYCWMKSLDPNDLRRLADGETLKALEADLCEADIAIWLKNQGIPFTPKRMANYKIRELLIYWYENVKGTSYF